MFDSYNTLLPLDREIDYYLTKQQSPFANDSGYDYDYRGYYSKYGSFNPSSNMHLTDEFKKPNHPTFSVESIYYTGQPYAINWNKEPYKTLSKLGIL